MCLDGGCAHPMIPRFLMTGNGSDKHCCASGCPAIRDPGF
ncbi:hypothetical protein GWL_00600 [Herbaspirillum sp. GW103]|nr:hypothetical protein GWL_00600 [Herbaspirillum sp. GW103]